ncbi:hypothetical protein FRB90_001965 [Tulasnella sp. 427]|nr:hypothetical protein FRB90_001965 [Tulasnella sp. 427]
MFCRIAALAACALLATLSTAQDAGRQVDTIVDDTDSSILYDTSLSGLWGVGVKVVIAARDTPQTWTNISFLVDNTNMGQYLLEGTSANQLLYNITAFEAENLSNTSHVLDIVGGEGSEVAMYLDYIQYTQLLPTSTTITSTTSAITSSASRSSSAASPPSSTSAAAGSIADTSSSDSQSQTSQRLSPTGIAGIVLAVGVGALIIGNMVIWALQRSKRANKRPRRSKEALLKFHQDIARPRKRMSEEGFSETEHATTDEFEKASFDIAYIPRHGLALPLFQDPPARVARKGR